MNTLNQFTRTVASITRTNSRHYVDSMPRLGLSGLFQTFEDLESVVDKEAEIASIRELLDEGNPQ